MVNFKITFCIFYRFYYIRDRDDNPETDEVAIFCQAQNFFALFLLKPVDSFRSFRLMYVYTRSVWHTD